MSATIDRITAIIEAHELDTLTVFAVDGAKLDHVHGSTSDLCTVVQLLPESFQGVVTVEAYQEQQGTTRGRKKDADKPFRWKVQCGTPAMAAPAAPAAATIKEVKVPDVEALQRAADSRADARIAEHGRTAAEQEAAELRARVAELELQLQEAEEDEEEEDETMGALPWYADEEKTVNMIGHLRSLFGASKPAAPVPPAEGLSDTEREMLQAFRAYESAHPDDARAIRTNLLNNFGTKPDTDGNASE